MFLKYANKLINLTIFSIIFIIPLSFFLSAHESFEMPKSTNFYVFSALSLTLFIIIIFLSKKTIYFTQFSLTLLALVIIFFFSLLKSILINKYSFPIHWQFFKLILFCLFIYFIIINVFFRKDINKLLFFILLSHFVVVLYGVLQYFGIDFINWISFGEGRVYSTMGNPDYMAAQFSILIPFLIVLLISPVKNTYKILLTLFLFLMLMLIIVSHGRGAWLGFIVSLIYMFIMFAIFYGKEFFIKYKLFFTSIIVFIIFLIIIFSIPNPLNKNSIIKRIKELNLENDAVVVRLFYWESALQMIKSNPFLGVGIGGFSLNSSFYQRKVFDRWEKSHPALARKVAPHVELYTHNDYLQTLAETGILGFGVYLLCFFSILVMSFSKAIKEQNILYKNLLLGITGSIIAFLINGLLNFPWRVIPTLILLFLIFSIFSLFENKKPINFNYLPSRLIISLFLIFLPVFSVLQIQSFIANMCIKLGQTQFSQEKYEDAKNTFLRALSSNPRGTDKIELSLYTGNAFNSLKQIDKAIYYYNEGLKMFPNFIEAHYNVGNVYMNNNLTEKAIQEYKKVLALNPKFTNAINNLANIYFAKGEYEKAMTMYLQALEIKPDNPDTRFNLSASYFRLKQYDKAYSELKKILEYTPDYKLAIEWIEKMQQMGLVKK